MKLLKRMFSLLLVLTLLLETSITVSYAQMLPGIRYDEDEEEEEKPQNPPGTPEGVTCTGPEEKPGPHGVCCVGLELNAGGFCDEPSLKDSSLVSCVEIQPDGTKKELACGSGMGCLPQTTEHLFNGLAPTTLSSEELSDYRSELEAQIADIENPQPVGGFCTHDKHCQTYSCVANKCEEVKVCRKAAEGEVVPPGVQCGPNLVRNVMTGKCELSPEARNSVYLGLLDEATIRPVAQCQNYELDPAIKEKSILAMKSLRAMEWFFSTISLEPVYEDCFLVTPLLKEEIGMAMYEARKIILENFTEVLNGIEDDYKLIYDSTQLYSESLKSGKENEIDDKTNHTLHLNEKITQKDIGSRSYSGYDALMIMYRRNLLFQSYEMAMLEVLKEIAPKVSGLSQKMATWNDGDTSWDIGVRKVTGFSCPGSKYKKKKKWRWKTKYYDTVKDRWTHYYQVTGSAQDNAEIVKREKVSKMLALLSGYDDKVVGEEKDAAMKAAIDKAISEFTRPTYYLMEPLLFAEMKHGQYGQKKSLKKSSGFLGFSGFKDLRQAYYIRGDSAGSYKKMHNDLGQRVRKFYKTLQKDPDQPKFIFEPELVTTNAKDCLKDGKRTEQCSDFDAFLDDVTDEAFAYFLAYSYHTTDSYKNFFRMANTYRRKLLAKLEVDLNNISKYYETVIAHREEQNGCIEKVINSILENGIVADGTENSVAEGGAYTPTTLNSTPLKGLPGGSKAMTVKSSMPKLSAANRNKFRFNLRDSSLKSIQDKSLLDSVSSVDGNSMKAEVGSNIGSFLAIRAEEMKQANKKAAASGVNVSGKEKVTKELISSLSKSVSGNSLAASGVSGVSTDKTYIFRNGGASSSTDDASKVNGGEVNGAGVRGEIAIGGNAGGAGGDGAGSDDPNAVTNPFAGLEDAAGGAGSQHGGAGSVAGAMDGAQGALGSGDLSGLSDDEREKLLSEAEKNRRDYLGNEDDGIFKKVSKAYVRNLDKVLIRKKKEE